MRVAASCGLLAVWKTDILVYAGTGPCDALLSAAPKEVRVGGQALRPLAGTERDVLDIRVEGLPVAFSKRRTEGESSAQRRGESRAPRSVTVDSL